VREGPVAACCLLLGCAAVVTRSPPREPNERITILYDAFGREPGMKKDWGFSALVEVGGRRILFDTGDDPAIFAANAAAAGVDLRRLVSDAPGTKELKELSLAIDTPGGIVLVVGCSHPGIEAIVAAALHSKVKNGGVVASTVGPPPGDSARGVMG
jgi:metal-dependent hydrolase (beta-lactamase superfamily II)